MTGATIEITLGSASAERPTSASQRPNLLVLVDLPVTIPGALQHLDLDTMDQVLAGISDSPSLTVDILDQHQTARFTATELESFDPAAVAAHFEVLETLNRLCRDLKKPQHAAKARRQLTELLEMTPPPAAPAATAPRPDASDFERLMGAAGPARVQEPDRAGALVRGLLADSAGITPAHDEVLIQAVQDVRVHALRRLLADPQLKSLERLWRSIHWLVTALDPRDGVRLWLLAGDFAAAGVETPEDSSCLAAVAESIRRHDVLGQSGVDAILLDRETRGADDVRVLSALGRLAAQLHTTVFAAAPPGLADSDVPDEPLTAAWDALRRSPAGAHVAAAAPRLMLRPPYGKRGESCDVPEFEELPPAPDHEAFLWGNPAYALAALVCQAHERSGQWPPPIDAALQLDAVPLAVYDDGTGDALMPPSERYLDEREVMRLRGLGIMAVQSLRNRDAVQLAGFHSVAAG